MGAYLAPCRSVTVYRAVDRARIQMVTPIVCWQYHLHQWQPFPCRHFTALRHLWPGLNLYVAHWPSYRSVQFGLAFGGFRCRATQHYSSRLDVRSVLQRSAVDDEFVRAEKAARLYHFITRTQSPELVRVRHVPSHVPLLLGYL